MKRLASDVAWDKNYFGDHDLSSLQFPKKQMHMLHSHIVSSLCHTEPLEKEDLLEGYFAQSFACFSTSTSSHHPPPPLPHLPPSQPQELQLDSTTESAKLWDCSIEYIQAVYHISISASWLGPKGWPFYTSFTVVSYSIYLEDTEPQHLQSAHSCEIPIVFLCILA